MIDASNIYSAAGLTAEEVALMPDMLAGCGDSGEIDFADSRAFEKLYDYFTATTGEMPYGTAKARDGDPVDWIIDRLGE